ncbi:ReoY family proteolytic degradation factor [Virgibacillus sp. MSJ-26]|uniref:ReoY family proteolytic degradation factor n=1 Tax=Virgibacillus sp. MSJ-26 TaxID=2841522 RepID=UPI001C0FA327|nr:ReoY family proteolytic degradation factor [Virgibacillus sp. MSJ-26]MBU5466595.1 ReoY family proteolytic degradation factor [Virgibacillus sp. MSJ-26]
MQAPVSVSDKKNFIRWFLNNYQLKKRESVWILNYLLNHDEVLTHVHFVRDARFSPRGIIMTCYCSSEVPFRFNKKQIVTTDADKSFHDIRLNQNEPLYIQLNFKNANQNPIYARVLEDNPHHPDDCNLTETDRLLAKKFLERSLYEYQLKRIKKNIDESLDEKNYKNFLFWRKELEQLNKGSNYQPYSEE